jgi:hypothetical protein
MDIQNLPGRSSFGACQRVPSSNSCCKKVSRLCFHAPRAFASSLRHGFSLWVRAFLTSAHPFFRFCSGGGGRRFGGFLFVDELTSGRYIFKRQLNPTL